MNQDMTTTKSLAAAEDAHKKRQGQTFAERQFDSEGRDRYESRAAQNGMSAEAMAAARTLKNYLKMKTKNEIPRFEVVVGSLGSVEMTDNYGVACKAYGQYKSQSIQGYGRASSEYVTLLDHGEPRLEHYGESIERFDVELTDTFGGDPNYSWVLRATIEVPEGASQALVMRHAKKAMGINGAAGKTTSYGDTYEFRPYGICEVMFVTFNEN